MKAHTALATSLGTLLGSVALGAIPAPAYATWANDNPAGTTQCKDVDINDAGVKVINCLMSNTRVVFYKIGSGTAGQLAPLASTGGGVPCVGGGLSNGAATNSIIVGECRDANNVWQAVAWSTARPGSGPVLLAPILDLLGLGAGVSTAATAVNSNGLIAGESVDGGGTDTPVTWSATGVATALVAPLLGSVSNCELADLTDAATPQLIGNCPNGAGGAGKNLAVLWTTPSTAYIALPVPSGASYCSVAEINVNNQILGNCIYGTDTYRVVQWGAGGSGPTVMQTLSAGGAVLRTLGVDMNDSGVIAGTYLSGGSTAGLPQTFAWNPASGNTVGTGITPPANGTNGVPMAIGNNAKVVGNYFVPTGGSVHPFIVASGSNSAVDEGVCASGVDATVSSLSKSGAQEAGSCISTSGNSIGTEEPTP